MIGNATAGLGGLIVTLLELFRAGRRMHHRGRRLAPQVAHRSTEAGAKRSGAAATSCSPRSA